MHNEKTLAKQQIKLHLFRPSNREIWSIVGKENEHWMSDDASFCSCPGFYFGKLNDNKPCYHIQAVKDARSKGAFDTISFVDDEYENFVTALISDLYNFS